jgi:NAD(P)-dependent dehydrogenase (short-subunit alcohol dehydrogenase family)
MASGRFVGQVVMITGAAGGFGAEAAIRFADEGADLVLSDLDDRGLKETVKRLRSHKARIYAEQYDITNEKQVVDYLAAAMETMGPIDVAINNAGIGQNLAPITETTQAEFERIMSVNTTGVFLALKHQLPGMIARRQGVILNVASAAGLVGAGHLAAYAASKHAVVGLTRSAADEVARKGIRVNALCPSFAPTPLFNAIADDIGARHGIDRDTAYRRIVSRIPMRRMAQIGEVVQAMLWACDPANTFMTGQTISIDGGLTAV